MPRIIVENLPEKAFSPMAGNLASDVSAAINCPIDWISVSLLSIEVYTPSFPVINVYWFPREKSDQDAAAEAIHKLFLKNGYNSMQIYFHHLDSKGFYEFN